MVRARGLLNRRNNMPRKSALDVKGQHVHICLKVRKCIHVQDQCGRRPITDFTLRPARSLKKISQESLLHYSLQLTLPGESTSGLFRSFSQSCSECIRSQSSDPKVFAWESRHARVARIRQSTRPKRGAFALQRGLSAVVCVTRGQVWPITKKGGRP
jgi:hypothetical protein